MTRSGHTDVRPVHRASHDPERSTYPRSMKRLLLLTALVAFVVWRGRILERHDRTHHLGPYADVAPVDRS